MRRSAIEYIESKQARKEITQFRSGDTVRVHWKVKEGEKERVQPFEGVVIRKTEGGIRSTFTVRKVSYGVGVERIFPLHSPRYEKIEVLTRGSVNRARLFYLRNLRGKASRVTTQEEAEAAAAASVAGQKCREGLSPGSPAPPVRRGRGPEGVAPAAPFRRFPIRAVSRW